MMKTTQRFALSLLLLAATGATHAHITLEQQEAPAGGAYKAVLRVGHGCEGSATRQLIVTLPPGLRGAKPQPKPGWTLSLRRAKLVQPYESHGRMIDEELSEVTWTAQNEAAQLQDDWYDEFILRTQLPQQAGPLWFKVRQVCVKSESDWSEQPASGSSTRGLKLPAALLQVTPTAPAAHQH